MTIFQAFFLGTLQGITEFLPISSSGHLVLAELVFHIRIPEKDLQGINILLHAGTLLALLIVYAKTWISIVFAPFRGDKYHTNKCILLIVATIPGAVVGVLWEDAIAEYFQSPLSIGLAFSVTGLLLILSELYPDNMQTIWHRMLHPNLQSTHLTIRSAVLIGIAQAFALIPGISRSGSTISAGRMMGLSRREALDFSFLMATPIIAGASAMTFLDILSHRIMLPAVPIISIAVLTSFCTSMFAILFLRAFVVRRSLAWFSPYLFIVSIATILLALHKA